MLFFDHFKISFRSPFFPFFVPLSFYPLLLSLPFLSSLHLFLGPPLPSFFSPLRLNPLISLSHFALPYHLMPY